MDDAHADPVPVQGGNDARFGGRDIPDHIGFRQAPGPTLAEAFGTAQRCDQRVEFGGRRAIGQRIAQLHRSDLGRRVEACQNHQFGPQRQAEIDKAGVFRFGEPAHNLCDFEGIPGGRCEGLAHVGDKCGRLAARAVCRCHQRMCQGTRVLFCFP